MISTHCQKRFCEKWLEYADFLTMQRRNRPDVTTTDISKLDEQTMKLHNPPRLGSSIS
ncbi:hypothetical protein FD47_GL000049 [Lentilactobacillus parafarraginis DSM 18390 = JCM 14109]|uniref:Uncharacterized protein n=1 Tax=Lentilactobacillus parafarraginis DSM 18390 = JCM 14109 TaxID=1423786 RepID=A0A0R1Z1X0_9LACO|nr:hypothetical protein FD47_GL000049 [Lentilactobacillus parafarraginis DSM 18390 = JCM 14109]